ncbi:ATP-binding protein [Streptomyces sp. NBC_01546]|uniref:ATP-binding protein n=1 Tax=Streptomyces sp. NBC_01546 TaxID=2975872 RepID=UPI003870DB73
MNSTLTHMPLRGREREMRLIREVLEYGRRSGPAVLSIEGMPGIGKTRLLQEAAALADGLGYAGHHPDPWADPRHLRRRTVPARHTRGRPGRCHAPAGPVLVLVDDTRRAVDGPPRMPFAPANGPAANPSSGWWPTGPARRRPCRPASRAAASGCRWDRWDRPTR